MSFSGDNKRDGGMLGGRAAEAVYPVLPLPLNSHVEKQDRQAESFAQTRHGAQTQYKQSKENLYPSVNLMKTLYRSTGCRSTHTSQKRENDDDDDGL